MTSRLLDLQNHPVYTHANELQSLCAKLASLDITTFSHLRVFEDKKLTVLCNRPDFLLNYQEKKYYEADPCVNIKPESTDFGQYLLWDHVSCSGKTAAMLQDSAEFNFKHVFTIIKNYSTHQDFYHFGTHLSDPFINHIYINNLEELNQFISFFNNKISESTILSRAYQLPINLDQKNSNICIKNNNLFSIKKINTNFFGPVLTQKEIECASLLLQGKSAKEIAYALQLSVRTIEDRINSLKFKLVAKNKSDLIVKLLQVNYLLS